MYNCKYCNKPSNFKGGNCFHENRCIKNPNRKVFSWVGRKRSEEERKKISLGMMGNRNANHRGDRQTFYKNIRMDSRWEAGVAKYFDRMKYEWIYNEKGFKLSDGRYYYPDFFIYENGIFKKLIEVKGFFRECNRKKYELFKSEYPDIKIELWEKEILKEKEIIDVEGYVINYDASVDR